MAFVEVSLIYFFDHLVDPHALQQPKKLLLVLRTSLAHLCQLPSPCTYLFPCTEPPGWLLEHFIAAAGLPCEQGFNHDTTCKLRSTERGHCHEPCQKSVSARLSLPGLSNKISMSQPMASVATKDRQRRLFWQGLGVCYCNEGIALVQQSHEMWHRHRCRQSGGSVFQQNHSTSYPTHSHTPS